MKPENALAVLTADLHQTPDGWQQLLPKGCFKSRDGSPFDVPHWQLNAEIAERLIQKIRSLNQDVLIDYEHESLFTAKKHGGAVLAAGWFNADEIRWFDEANRQGLFIRPRWTQKAYAHIKAGEFAYLSAVFTYDKQGVPLELRMAALTNDPGVTGMQRLAVLNARTLSTHHKEQAMNLSQLLDKLGLTATGDDGNDFNQALATIDGLNGQVATLSAQLNEKTASLSAKLNEQVQVDLSQYVPKATYDATVAEMAVLSARLNQNEVVSVIDAARAQGKVLKAEEDYLHQFGNQQGVAALSAMLNARPALSALSGGQTDNLTQPSESNTARLSASDLTACQLLGLTETEFLTVMESA